MPEAQEPVRITDVTLRPRIAVAGEASEERVQWLVETAHGYGFIANSLRCAMTIEATVERR
jgi:organic hydroperoxide reductase OsmC/OhrA